MRIKILPLVIATIVLSLVAGCSQISRSTVPPPTNAPLPLSSSSSSVSQPPTSSAPVLTANSIVVDNNQPSFAIQTGDWGICKGSDCSGVPFGSDFRFAEPGCTNCRAQFTLQVANAGSYELYAWWPYGNDRATDTPFTIQYSGGTITLQIDQRHSGNDWFWLHTLSVKGGETVSVSVGGTRTGFANADAIALYPTGTSPAAAQSATSQPSAPQPTQVTVAQPTKSSSVPPTVPPVAGKTGQFRRVIFLHHSTGQGLIDQGNLRQQITALGYEFYDHGYNGDGLTLADGQNANMNFDIPDDNTDPDGFNVLFAQPIHTPPDNAFSYLMQYDVIVFKSCFPTSNIESNEQLEQYKAYYRNIRAVIDKYPNKVFVVVTPPPNTPAETNSQNAGRARTWAKWLKSPEFLNGHPNVFAFDLFDLLAESNSGARDYNMLRATYRRPDPNDSHPNERANREIAPQLANFIVQSIKNYTNK